MLAGAQPRPRNGGATWSAPMGSPGPSARSTLEPRRPPPRKRLCWRRGIARIAELGVLAGRAPALAVELDRARALTALQARTRAAARELGLTPSVAAAHGALEAAAAERAEQDRLREQKEMEAERALRTL